MSSDNIHLHHYIREEGRLVLITLCKEIEFCHSDLASWADYVGYHASTFNRNVSTDLITCNECLEYLVFWEIQNVV